MYAAAICVAENEYAEWIRDAIKSLEDSGENKIKLYRFSNSDSFLIALLKARLSVDLVIISTQLPDGPGINTVKNIRKYFSDMDVIFISENYDYLCDAFIINAKGYFVAPFKSEEFKKVLKDILQNNSGESSMSIKKRGMQQEINFKDILYIESRGRIATVVTEDSRSDTYASLSGMEISLPQKNFVRCHKSFIVNLEKIESIKDNVVKLVNGEEIYVGRVYKRQLLSAYSKNQTCLGEEENAGDSK